MDKPVNQCDGCRSGKPLNQFDQHMMGTIVKPGWRPTEFDPIKKIWRELRYVDLQACTAERYGHEPGCPPDGPHCHRCGYCEFKLGGEQCLCYAR